MTRRRDLERQRHSLGEIRDIMNSMKTLATMETRKLAGFLDAQQRVVASIETAAADFLRFHPEQWPRSVGDRTACILVGSERGFCGDFNHRLESALAGMTEQETGTRQTLIALGHKLHPLIPARDPEAVLLPGAGVLEEIPELLDRLSEELARLHQSQGIDRLVCLFHDSEGELVTRSLLPPFGDLEPAPSDNALPPLLNLAPGEFLASLTEHYLVALLHWILYASLMAENRRRVSHLDGAVRHLDNQSLELTHRYNRLRQEEIIEEIEVILLSAG